MIRKLVLLLAPLALAACGESIHAPTYCAMIAAPGADARTVLEVFDSFAAEQNLRTAYKGDFSRTYIYDADLTDVTVFAESNGQGAAIVVRPGGKVENEDLPRKAEAFVESRVATRWPVSACASDPLLSPAAPEETVVETTAPAP